MSKPVLTLLAAVVAIGVLVAGCGSSSDNGTSESASSLTKAEFVKQGNAICAEGNKQIGEEFEEFGKEHGFSKKHQPTQAELTEGAEQIVIPQIRRELEKIKALGAPSGEEAEVEAVTDAAEKALEQGEEDPTLLVEEGAGPFKEANKLAREYGLVKCGEEEGE